MLDQDNSRLTVRNGTLPSGFLLATGEDSGDLPQRLPSISSLLAA